MFNKDDDKLTSDSTTQYGEHTRVMSIGIDGTNEGYIVKPIRVFKAQVVTMLLLVLFSFLVFFDRASLPVANLLIQSDFGIGAAGFGVLMTLPFLCYGFFQLVSGFLLNNFRSRYVLGISFAIWSCFQVFIGVGHSFFSLLFYRMGIAASAAPVVLGGVKAISEWFNVRERPSMTAIYNSSTVFSNALAPIVVVMFMTSYGWRFVFSFLGVIGIFAVTIWFLFYKDKSSFRSTADEDEYFSDRNNMQKVAAASSLSFEEWLALFKRPIVFWLVIGFTGANFTSIFYITWLPGYLQLTHNLSLLDMGIVAVIPFFVGGLGMISSNNIFNFIVNSFGYEVTVYRRCMFIALFMIASSVCTFFLMYADDSLVCAVALMSFALAFIHIAGTQCWVLIHTIAPKRYVVSVSSIQNSGSFVIASFAPIIAGVAYDATASFNLAFQACSIIALLGAFAYLVVMNRYSSTQNWG